jgi:hypothetical protein
VKAYDILVAIEQAQTRLKDVNNAISNIYLQLQKIQQVKEK